MTLRGADKLAGVHPDLVRLIERVALRFPIVVLEGLRTKERQAQLVLEGKSKTLNSKHLVGRAIDVAPDPIDWNDIKRFAAMGGYIVATAEALEIGVTWGGDWNRNWDFKDQSFHDLPHIELI